MCRSWLAFASASGSDGIVQLSTGGREFASGSKVKDMVTGAVAMAEFAHVVAAKYPVTWCYTPTTVRKTSSTTTSVR
jgi:fructose/tagatose bisphosphate aldolase